MFWRKSSHHTVIKYWKWALSRCTSHVEYQNACFRIFETKPVEKSIFSPTNKNENNKGSQDPFCYCRTRYSPENSFNQDQSRRRCLGIRYEKFYSRWGQQKCMFVQLLVIIIWFSANNQFSSRIQCEGVEKRTQLVILFVCLMSLFLVWHEELPFSVFCEHDICAKRNDSHSCLTEPERIMSYA